MNTRMNQIPTLGIVLLLGLFLSFPILSHEKPDKYYGVAHVVLMKGCGDGLDQNSPCGGCTRVIGAAITKYASCGHACLKLPDRLNPSLVTVVPSGVEGSNPVVGGYVKCGKGEVNAPCVGWDRFEQTEWYSDTHQICGRFKNWSNDRDRSYSIQVYEK